MEVFCPRIRKNKTEQVNSGIDNETMTSSVSKKKNLVNISEEPPINLHPNMSKVSMKHIIINLTYKLAALAGWPPDHQTISDRKLYGFYFHFHT